MDKVSFYDMIIVVIVVQNEFDKEMKVKLYRNIQEILHPTISKKNISDYKIIIDEDILPVYVFYPKKVTDLEKVILYVHGNGNVTGCLSKYSDICRNFALKTNHLVIAIDYPFFKKNYKQMVEEVYRSIQYLFLGLERNGILKEDICLMGDSTGCHIITGIQYIGHGEVPIQKEILFYPTLSLEYFGNSSYDSIEKNKHFNFGLLESLQEYYSFLTYKKDRKDPFVNVFERNDFQAVENVLILTGNADCVLDEDRAYYELLPSVHKKCVELPFASHGFLKNMDKELSDEVYLEVNQFLK